jgi:uncharacterized protein involved in copper resistance
MTKTTIAAALALAAMMPLTASATPIEATDNTAPLCIEAPAKAASAGIDCTATSRIGKDDQADAKAYPAGPVNFGNGIVF